MSTNRAVCWVETYLYRARGHRALEQSVFAEGERRGFSERKLRRAARSLAVQFNAGCWELHPARVAALAQHEIAQLTLIPTLGYEPALAPRVA